MMMLKLKVKKKKRLKKEIRYNDFGNLMLFLRLFFKFKIVNICDSPMDFLN